MSTEIYMVDDDLNLISDIDPSYFRLWIWGSNPNDKDPKRHVPHVYVTADCFERMNGSYPTETLTEIVADWIADCCCESDLATAESQELIEAVQLGIAAGIERWKAQTGP